MVIHWTCLTKVMQTNAKCGLSLCLTCIFFSPTVWTNQSFCCCLRGLFLFCLVFPVFVVHDSMSLSPIFVRLHKSIGRFCLILSSFVSNILNKPIWSSRHFIYCWDFLSISQIESSEKLSMEKKEIEWLEANAIFPIKVTKSVNNLYLYLTNNWIKYFTFIRSYAF